jgi:AraC-like DNA-binding protein
MNRQLKVYHGIDLFCHHSVDDSPDPGDFKMHTHEWYELFFFISGDASFLVEGTMYDLRKNDLLIMRSAESHMLCVQPGTPYERLAVHFSPSIIRSIDECGILLEPFTRRPLGKGNLFRIPSAASLFERFVKNTDVRAERAMLLSSLLDALSAVYAASSVRGAQPAGEPDPETGKNALGRRAQPASHASQGGAGIAAELIEYINERLFSELSLNDLCARFFMSRSQLERIFRKATGSSVWKYVLVKRLITARQRILAGYKAYPAALSCGFKDYSSFYRAYSAYFGHAPSEDRRKAGD